MFSKEEKGDAYWLDEYINDIDERIVVIIIVSGNSNYQKDIPHS